MTRAGRMRVVLAAGSLVGSVVLACSASASGSVSAQPSARPCSGLTGTALLQCTAAVRGCKTAAKSPAARQLCLAKVGQEFAPLRTTATVTMRVRNGGRLSFDALSFQASLGSASANQPGIGSYSVVITTNHDATSKRLQSLRLRHGFWISRMTIVLAASAGGQSYLLLDARITRFSSSSTKGRRIDVFTFEGQHFHAVH